jgi:hypothetical protein
MNYLTIALGNESASSSPGANEFFKPQNEQKALDWIKLRCSIMVRALESSAFTQPERGLMAIAQLKVTELQVYRKVLDSLSQ